CPFLLAFPTRRSSDLLRPEIVEYRLQRLLLRDLRLDALVHSIDHTDLPLRFELLEIPAETEHVRSELLWRLLSRDIDTWLTVARSEEHTSELQSRVDL